MNLVSKLKDLAWEARLGIDTSGLKPSTHPDGVHYGASPYQCVGKALDLLKLEPWDHFCDIGCGRGRVLVMAARREMRRITGVEFDPALAREAQANVDLQIRKRTPDCLVHTCDAGEFSYRGITAAYMFNPAEVPLLNRILMAIETTAPTRVFRIVTVNLSDVQKSVFYKRNWKRLREKSIKPYLNPTTVFVPFDHDGVGDCFADDVS